MKNLVKNLLFLVLMMLISGCSLNNPKQDQNLTITNDELPTIDSFNTISEMTAIAFEWQRVDDVNVAGYYLYRSDDGLDLKKVATIKDKYSTHFVDTNLKADTHYEYAMATFDSNGNSSKIGTRYSLQTSPALSSIELVQVISNLPSRAKIVWTPHSDARVVSYIIEKNDISVNKWEKLTEVKGRLSAEYIDSPLKPGHTYSYRVSAKTSDGILSSASTPQIASVKPLPKTILNVIATNYEPKKIVISWDLAEEDDIKHYVIYSSRSNLLPASKLATTQDNKYEDIINSDGATRYYKVTAVNYDNEEGLKQDVFTQGNTLSLPQAPAINTAKFTSQGIELAWNADLRSKSFKILKSSKLGKEEFTTNNNYYLDTNLQDGIEYTYKIIAFDEYALASKESKKAVVKAK